MSKSTMVELVDELMKLPPNPLIAQMIEEAKAGEYHDFKNEKYACGKVTSAGFLIQIADMYPECKDGALRIRDMIINGEFDESPDQEDTDRLCELIDVDTNMSPNQKNVFKETMGLKNNVKHGQFGKKYF